MPRIKFIWGGPKQMPGHWRLGLWGTYEKQVGSRRKVAVSLRGLLLWLAGAAAAVYVAGATVLFFWFERKDYNLVTYSDTLLLPLRWDDVRQKRGRMMIEEGLADLQAQRWSEAHMKLRVGLSRAPGETRARLALAEFYVLSNRRPQAIELLVAGLGDEYPGKRYLTTLFTLASQGEEFERIAAAGERYDRTAGEDREWLLTQRLAALNGAGRYEEALRLAEGEGEGADSTVREARVLALVELGRNEEALNVLAQWLSAIPAHRAQIARLRVRALRELGRDAEMEAALEEFRRLSPADPRAYVYGLVQRWMAGDRDGADEALDEFFRRFAASPQHLLLAATAASEAKALPLVRRCVERAAAHGFPLPRFKHVLLQTEIAAREWNAAAATLSEMKQQDAKREPGEEFMLTWLERLLAAASTVDGGTETMLLDLLRQRPLPLRVYRETVEVLAGAGRYQSASSVLDVAERSYRASATLARLRRDIDESRAAQTPVEEPVEPKAEKFVWAEEAFFETLAGLETGEQWSDAARTVREVRVAKPGWLASREADVLEAQMRIATQTGDMLEMLGAAKLFLDGSVNRGLRVVALARELGADGKREQGELLLREVLRKHPDFPPVLRLRKEWAPADDAGKS